MPSCLILQIKSVIEIFVNIFLNTILFMIYMVKILPVILEKLIRSLESVNTGVKVDKKFASKWLGAFKDIIPDDVTSTEYIKKMRESCYGKTPDIS